MKVMLLAYEAPEDFALREEEEKLKAYMGEWYAFGEALRKNNVYESSGALDAPTTATVVSVRDGIRNVQDGPFPDTKEQLGGFCIVEVADLAEATEWATKCPAAKNGYVDVRPVPYLETGAPS